MANQNIVNVAPDFEQLFAELEQRLAAKQTWRDLYETSMGSTIMDMFAASGVTNQLQIELSLRETFLITAKRESSIAASTRSLGVRIGRKSSASGLAYILNDTDQAVFVAPYSKFLVDGSIFFNKDQLVFAPHEERENVALYEGDVLTYTLDLDTLSDREYYEVVIDSAPYTVSNEELLVYTVNKTTQGIRMWDKTTKALFEHEGDDSIYYESTNGDGKPSLIFGNDENGRMLPSNEILNIRYVVTNGANANGIKSGTQLSLAANPNVAGSFSSTIDGGSNQKNSAYYKKFAPYLFRAKETIITPIEWRAAIATYPGVADAYVQGQRHIAPKDPTWMNNVRVTVLPENTDTLGGANPNPRSPAWEALRVWLQKRIHTNTVIQTWNAEKILTDIHIKVAVNAAVNAEEIKLQISENIYALFEKKPGILGRKLAISDISDAAKAVSGVDYVEVLKPTKSIEPSDKTQYVALQTTPKIDVVLTERVDSNV